MRSRLFSAEMLKDAGRVSTDAPGCSRTRNALVVGQIALAVVLLTVSGLMVRTFVSMRHIQPGFTRPAEVQTFELSLPATLIRDAKQVVPTYEQISARLGQIPGVTAVGLGVISMDGSAAKGPIFVEGLDAPALPPIRFMWPVGPGYFEALGSRILAGRTLTWTDIQQRTPVVLISENLALEYWDAPANAIGHRIRTFATDPWQEIIGVVGNVRAEGLNQPAPALVFQSVANAQTVNRFMMYVVRSSRAGSPSFIREMQQSVWSVNGSLPLAAVKTLDEIQATSIAQTSFATVMLALAASIALVLAVVGIYSVVSHMAAARTREVGIRMALGAQTGDVRRLFLRQGVTLIAVGIAIGLGGATVMSPVMSALLHGVGPNDPATYAAVSAVVAGVTLLATYLPARRASRIQPIVALRSSA
jgi:predicted permease